MLTHNTTRAMITRIGDVQIKWNMPAARSTRDVSTLIKLMILPLFHPSAAAAAAAVVAEHFFLESGWELPGFLALIRCMMFCFSAFSVALPIWSSLCSPSAAFPPALALDEILIALSNMAVVRTARDSPPTSIPLYIKCAFPRL